MLKVGSYLNQRFTQYVADMEYPFPLEIENNLFCPCEFSVALRAAGLVQFGNHGYRATLSPCPIITVTVIGTPK